MGHPDRYQTGLPVQRHPLRAALMAAAGALGIAGGTAGFFVLDVPNWQPLDVSRITAAPQTGRMYDGEGQLIMTIKGSQNRVVIPFDDIPEQTRNVFLAAEDLRFTSTTAWTWCASSARWQPTSEAVTPRGPAPSPCSSYAKAI
ncbi:MAG: hypothetical protein ACLUE8_09410 [Lachnospiraceae bacterium]